MENIELLSLFRVYKQVPQMQKDGRIVTNGTLYTVFKKNHWQRHIMLSQLLEQRHHLHYKSTKHAPSKELHSLLSLHKK